MAEEKFQIKPSLIMSDFENGLINAIKSSFQTSEQSQSPKIIGCYFHYIKALIKRAKSLRLITKKTYDEKTKLLIGLLKMLGSTLSQKKN